MGSIGSDKGNENEGIVNFWSKLTYRTLTLVLAEGILQLKIALKIVFRVFDATEHHDVVV